MNKKKEKPISEKVNQSKSKIKIDDPYSIQ